MTAFVFYAIMLAAVLNFLDAVYIQLGWPLLHDTDPDPDYARAAYHMAYAALQVALCNLLLWRSR